MAGNWLRRGVLLAAGAAAAMLAACGSGSIESQFVPGRIVAFGDAFADLGQTGTRYTVNDGGINIWTQQVAAAYGRNLQAAAAGGTSFATANARVAAKPDAAGNAATPTVEEQVTAFLAGNTVGPNDLVILSAGTADVIAEIRAVNAGTQTSAQAIANLRTAGRALGAQVRRLVQAGASHVAVMGVYDLGKSPWAVVTGQQGLLADASLRFNEELLVSIVDLGNTVLYVDAALQFNLMIASPGSYNMTNANTIVCTSVDPGPGIGLGTAQISSGRCTPSTVLPGANPALYLFADAVYPTAQGHRMLGDYAFSRLRQRW